ncbi:hypothetical protein [uncultured Brevundimonas sp.]|uniref:hypothetical protein n=1 Tax=uncultured Brevundimonas sp. TaxID=213418 RepID=UPI0026356FCE|nr:hypothetical protein [uncultured Brevundimonas sp.]
MRAVTKTVLATAIGAGAILLAGWSMAGDKGCLTCSPPPPPSPPPVPGHGGCSGGGCTPPTVPVCCGGGGNVNVNVNINNVGASASASANANAEARARAYSGARAGAGAGSTVIVGGGGAYFNVDQPYPLTAQGLAVEGGYRETVRVPVTSTRSWEKRYRIQAVCLDDRNVPHPASQVRPGKDVADSYEGELYRCIAGTTLQWTRSEGDGAGETVTCEKGQALWFGGGNLECRPQKRERDCHERSLLRRYGAGIKEVVLRGEETITEYREEVVERSLAVTGNMMMDGGVGGRVF